MKHTIEEGLPDNTITSLFKDSRGLIWIGTTRGIVCYDGYRFKEIKEHFPGNLTLNDKAINCISEDDDGVLWLGTQHHGIYNYDPELNKLNRIHHPEHKADLERISDIHVDSNGKIWIGTHGGLLLYHPVLESFHFFNHNPEDKYSIMKNGVMAIHEDIRGNMWFATWGTGINQYIPEINGFKRYDLSKQLNDNQANSIHDITSAPDSTLYIATQQGIIRLQSKRADYFLKDYFKNIYVRTLTYDFYNNTLWIGTHNAGLFEYSKYDDFVFNYRPDITDKFSLSDDIVSCLLIDHMDNIWVGTVNNGLNVSNQNHFMNDYITISPQNKVNRSVKRILTQDDYAWIRTENAGLARIHIAKKELQWYFKPETEQLIHTRYPLELRKTSDNNIWVIKDSISYRFDTINEIFQVDYLYPDTINLTADYVNLFGESSRGEMLFSYFNTIYEYNRNESEINEVPINIEDLDINISEVRDFYKDIEENYWISTEFELYHVNTYTGDIQAFNNNTGKIEGQTTLFHRDRYNRLWIGTTRGLYCFINKNRLERIFPSEIKGVSQLTEDKNGYLWINNSKSLIRYSPNENLLTQYFPPFNVYLESSALSITPQNKLVFGGQLNVFFREASLYERKNYNTEIYLTRLEINNQPVNPQNKLLNNEALNDIRKIKLDYTESTFSVAFSALDYNLSQKTVFEYRLKGFEKKWNTTDKDAPSATYHKIPGGSYTLEIRIPEKKATLPIVRREIDIEILPPVWQTAWFKAFVIFLVLFIIVLFYTLKTRNIRIRNMRLEKLVEDRTQELSASNKNLKLKTKELYERNSQLATTMDLLERQTTEIQEQSFEIFNRNMALRRVVLMREKLYTILAHDLKNPLINIKEIAQKQLQNIIHSDNKNVLESFNDINNSATRVISLFEELSNWNKNDFDILKPKPQLLPVGEIIKKAISFNEFHAKRKNIELKIEVDKGMKIYGDSGMVETVFRNLITNSVKFSPPGTVIELSASEKDDEVNVYLKDEGPGISDEQVKAIITKSEMDYVGIDTDGNASTGLGLKVCYDFILKNRGTLEIVKNNKNSGTTFIIRFKTKPWGHPGGKKTENRFDEDAIPELIRDSKILVVEDIKSIRNGIVETLSSFKTTKGVDNAETCLKVVEDYQPQLIVSDIIMPGMNGIELCKQLKANHVTCHIPILLLTARDDTTMKLSAYQAGAEAYITKPFDPRELLARISGLLINRNLTINKFNTSTSFDPGQLTKNPIDQQFISKANSITQKNISNPDFSSKELIQEMGMSRTAFFNKLKSLTGQSATEFIRTLRLKNAARMLQEKDNTITDVIYANGFNSREYFSRSFKQHFGVTPSKYKENVLLNTSLNNRS